MSFVLFPFFQNVLSSSLCVLSCTEDLYAFKSLTRLVVVQMITLKEATKRKEEVEG